MPERPSGEAICNLPRRRRTGGTRWNSARSTLAPAPNLNLNLNPRVMPVSFVGTGETRSRPWRGTRFDVGIIQLGSTSASGPEEGKPKKLESAAILFEG